MSGKAKELPKWPRRLEAGASVGVVSPGGPADQHRLSNGVALLAEQGLSVVTTPSATSRSGYLSAPDSQRRHDLQTLLDAPDIDAIVCTRGGFGSQRIVDELDFSAFIERRGVFLGFSDNTTIHQAIANAGELVTFYGPPLAWDPRNGNRSRNSLLKALMGERASEWRFPIDEAEMAASLTNVDRSVEGILRGGNLAMLTSSIGTRSSQTFRDSLLVIEDIREAPYRIDRMMTHLRRSRALEGLRGVVVGQLTDCLGSRGEPTAVDVLRQHFEDLEVPVLGGIPFGHGIDQVTIPLGAVGSFGPSSRALLATAVP